MMRRVAALSALAAILTACSRLGASHGLPAASLSFEPPTPAGRTKFATIFVFGGSDGLGPSGALIARDGKLYGTTSGGGKHGHGIVFSITPAGSEAVLHSFGGDGRAPTGSLLAVDGALYGATKYGGAHKSGTIFAMGADGSKLWTYDFKGGNDGAAPAGGLTNLRGALYGVTGSTFFRHEVGRRDGPARFYARPRWRAPQRQSRCGARRFLRHRERRRACKDFSWSRDAANNIRRRKRAA
jgi:uncharacterized repeat protein (TIGR03803 family)